MTDRIITPTDVPARLDLLGERIYRMNPEDHTPLMAHIVGGLKGKARFAPDSLIDAIEVLELAMESFEEGRQA
jgi:hypothetical protein